MKANSRHLSLLIGVLTVLGFTACRIDMKQEIWLKSDESGRARLEIKVNYPRLEDEAEDASLAQGNALEDFATRIEATEGASITKYEHGTKHNNEEFNYFYELEFVFDNLQSLRDVVCINPDGGFEMEMVGKKKQLTVDPWLFYLQEESTVSEYLDVMDIAMEIKLNLPKKPVEILSWQPNTQKGKTISWLFVLDDEWYYERKPPITIQL